MCTGAPAGQTQDWSMHLSASFAGRFQDSSGVNVEQADERRTLQIPNNMDETVPGANL